MIDRKNINSPAKFQEKLIEVMGGIYELFELSKEHNLEPVSKDGVTRYSEDLGKTCFQVSGQFDRPSEYLESLLDIIRANFEPHVLGTLFLNSNMTFLYNAISEAPFQLGYISITSESDKQFDLFWQDDVIPHINKCGYSVDDTSAIFAVASAGNKYYGMDFMTSVSTNLASGFSVDEVIGLLSASINETVKQPTKQVYTGDCLDEGLNNRMRLSLWLFIHPHDHPIQ